jgi:hypothetical protein
LEEGGEHRNFIGAGCWNVLTGGGVPLQNLTVREKVARNKLTDLAFIGLMAGVGVGVRQPWQGKKIAVSTERLREKWQSRM